MHWSALVCTGLTLCSVSACWWGLRPALARGWGVPPCEVPHDSPVGAGHPVASVGSLGWAEEADGCPRPWPCRAGRAGARPPPAPLRPLAPPCPVRGPCRAGKLAYAHLDLAGRGGIPRACLTHLLPAPGIESAASSRAEEPA